VREVGKSETQNATHSSHTDASGSAPVLVRVSDRISVGSSSPVLGSK